MRRQDFRRELAEFARADILLDLPVPFVRDILVEPLSKSSELGAVEPPDILFEFPDSCNALDTSARSLAPA